MLKSKVFKGKISESLLAQIWKGQWLVKKRLLTAEGRRVQVLYPGRLNPDCGPDFLRARLNFDGGELLEGDVELHIRSSDWRAHGHHQDPRYNEVALHVVMWDGRLAVFSENGKRVPTLALTACLEESLEEMLDWIHLPPLIPDPCFQAGEHFGLEAVAKLLDDAGEERFTSKGSFFKAALSGQEKAQVLYLGIMEALGYAKNKRPFGELGRRIPLRVLEDYARGAMGTRGETLLQALLFGTAGLLPSQRRRRPEIPGDAFVQEIEGLWSSSGIGAPMKEEDWVFYQVRPDNFPPRRIAGGIYLLSRYMKEGLFEGLLELFPGEMCSSCDSEALRDGLVVSGAGYWANHFDFGRDGLRNPALIGSERAGEIAVNVILPFFYAWSRLASKMELGRKARELYRAFPPLGSNRVTRQMTELLLGREGAGVVSSARRQQGLIHLYQTFCRERRCVECPASNQL